MKAQRKPIIALAPMMDYTDRHCRYLFRLLSKDMFMYTEMLTDLAVIHGDRDRLLGFDSTEHPIAIQLGGSEPKSMAQAASIAQDWGYDEINLNIGCPSDRVQKGQFGLSLLKDPKRVADIVAAIKSQVNIPVTVKTRIGVDEFDSYQYLEQFIATVQSAGCQDFWIHARKGWLNGLSPKENRMVPPLNFERVKAIKARFPDLFIGVNGGIATTEDVKDKLNHFDGVMIGRAAYHNPFWLAVLQSAIFGSPIVSREKITAQFLPYAQAMIAQNPRSRNMLRHIIGLYHEQPGARHWRRTLTAPYATEILSELFTMARCQELACQS